MGDLPQLPIWFVEHVGTRLGWPGSDICFGDCVAGREPTLLAFVNSDGSIPGWAEIRLPSVTVIVRWANEGMVATPKGAWDSSLSGEDWITLQRISNITEGELKRAAKRGGSDLWVVLAGTYVDAVPPIRKAS